MLRIYSASPDPGAGTQLLATGSGDLTRDLDYVSELLELT